MKRNFGLEEYGMSASSQYKQLDCSSEETLINDINIKSDENIDNEHVFRWNEQEEELTIICDDKRTLDEFSTHYCYSASADQSNMKILIKELCLRP